MKIKNTKLNRRYLTVCLAIKRKEEVSYKGPKSLSFRENSRSFCVWFLKHKTPLENQPLKDREKLQQKSSLDILRRNSVHVYLEDYQGSIIWVFFCSWAVYKLYTIEATQQLFWSFLFTPFQTFPLWLFFMSFINQLFDCNQSWT